MEVRPVRDFTCVALKGLGYTVCGEPAFKWLSRVPLCQRHYSDATHAASVAIQSDEAVWESIMHGSRDWDADAAEVVYYVRRLSDGLIKIGTSGLFRKRFSDLQGEHGPMQILLTHRGGRKTEDQMHREFESLWVTGEFFQPGKTLLAWIVKIRKRQLPGTELGGTVPLGDIQVLAAMSRMSESEKS